MTKWAGLLVALLLNGAMLGAASAQTHYPTRPIRIVIGFGPAASPTSPCGSSGRS